QLSSPAGFQDVSFTINSGEVVGMAGLIGAGRSQVAQAVFGLDPDVTGRMAVRGNLVRPRNPREAMRLGLGLVPEDRKRQGLVLSMGAADNATLAILETLARLFVIDDKQETEVAKHQFERLGVRAA